MSEINDEFWNMVSERETYENIDKDTLLDQVKTIKDMKKDVSELQQEFEKIHDINFQKGIKHKKSKEGMLEEVQCNAASTSTATQRKIKNITAKKIEKFDGQVKIKLPEYAEKTPLLKLIDHSKTDDSASSEVDDKKDELMRDDIHLLFVEIMYRDEIRKVSEQIRNISTRTSSMELKLWIPWLIESCHQQIGLIGYILELEDEVLNFKLKREQQRKARKEKTVGVEMTNMSCKIDQEKGKLILDNKYLRFAVMTCRKEIDRIFVQLGIYCDKYNIPNEEVKIAAHRDLIMQKIEVMKRISGQTVIDYNLQIEQEATDMETKDTETSGMSSKVDNSKNTLMRSNKYLRYIVMKHQEAINTVYAQLQKYCNEFNMALERENITAHSHLGADEIEKTNISSEIDLKSELRKSNEYLRSVRILYREEFINIVDSLQTYNDKSDIPIKNVTIVMHTEPYDHTKTNDEENNLKKDNEYLAFIAMMHQEKIKEICDVFEMYHNRLIDRFKEIATIKNWMKQQYRMLQIIIIKGYISLLKGNLDLLKYMK